MPIIEITSLNHPGVEVFSTLTEAQIRNRLEPSKGIFIAESPKVIHVALNAGYEPLAFGGFQSVAKLGFGKGGEDFYARMIQGGYFDNGHLFQHLVK